MKRAASVILLCLLTAFLLAGCGEKREKTYLMPITEAPITEVPATEPLATEAPATEPETSPLPETTAELYETGSDENMLNDTGEAG